MTKWEIERIKRFGLRKIKNGLAQIDLAIDSAGEDIICEYIQTIFRDWQRERKFILENSERAVQEILTRRIHETQKPKEVAFSVKTISEILPGYFEKMECARMIEAKRLAAVMPAIKV